MTITRKLLMSISAAALAASGMAEAAATSTTVRTKTTVTTRTATGHHRTHRVRRVAHRTRHGAVRQASTTRTTTTTTTTRTDNTAAGAPYYANRDYRDGAQYQERVLTPQDRVYAGEDGRYYCRRPDGTTGLIVGGAAGALLGNLIAKGNSSTLGTILGAGAGALAGREVEQRTVRCR